RIAIGDPLPDEIDILPPPDASAGCCSVEVQMEGIKEEGPEEDEEDTLQTEPLLPPDSHLNTSTPPADWGNGGDGEEFDGDPVCCAQCDDSSGLIWTCGTTEGSIPLHRECRRFWFKRHPQPKGRATAAVHIREIPRPTLGPPRR